MAPIQSYRIWFTPRTGSWLLAKGIESTNIAGRPGEHFNTDSLIKTYKVENYMALKEELWKLGMTPNGVFGIKHSMFKERYDKLFSEVLKLRNIKSFPAINHAEIWEDIFPNCKHIFITRRNKIRQAVSWWKALKDDIWHLEHRDEVKDEVAFYNQNYDFDGIHHLFRATALRECAIQAYFRKYDIKPMTLVYEDYIQDFDKNILALLNYLELDSSNIDIGKMQYRKTANKYSETWVQRFRDELQEKMGDKIW